MAHASQRNSSVKDTKAICLLLWLAASDVLQDAEECASVAIVVGT
jgi:hypothetical protein